MEMNAPIMMEMKVYAENAESEKQVVVTMSLPVGIYPTRKTLESIYKQAIDALPEGFEPMNKREFFNAWLSEEYHTTERFAVHGTENFIDDVIEMKEQKK